MIDIHNHLLPGLDDGSPDMETSIAMARMAVADGITHIVCTPHANHRYPYDPFRVEDLITSLRARLADAGILLQLARGADFHLTYENIQEAFADPAHFSIAGRGYLMTELPDYGAFSSFDEIYYELRLAGMTPVLTHPERNPTLQENRAKLLDWIRLGVLVQVTANSVLGHMGKKAQRMSFDLLEKKQVHFIATDAHNTSSRPPKMRETYDLIAKRYSAPYADKLFKSNPMCAFEGKPLAEDLELRASEENEESGKSWWQRLVRR
jgi:protein-tyrosine phosphatase